MLDYNRIAEIIRQKNFSLKYFIPRTTEMTVHGFKKAVENKTLKVSALEELSKALDLPMSFWWEGEDDLLSYTRNDKKEKELEVENTRLKKQVDINMKTIDTLSDQIYELKEQMGKKSDRKRAAG